ncbi:O-antigen polysaccharide polymerase Wzy [Bacillus nitratireducens]|uniref:O-antigen polysaccharide polymerase Wzy n=1 Tax=Bacillus nitratireducens TaxID=2026193 RepID=UPI002E1FA8BD|nr:O-antigen polysaccharide polymerase Wzy [Bacillus nitratireducens]
MNRYIFNTQKAKQKLILASMLWIAMISVFLYCLFVFIGFFPIPSTLEISWISVGICIVCLYILKQNKKIATFGLTSVLLIYTIFTQFGLGTIYYILGPEHVINYSDYTLRFLFSNQYVQAVILGLIAIMTYTIASSLGTIGEGSIAKRLSNSKKDDSNLEAKYAVWIGYLLLIIVLFYLLFQIAIGKISFSMGYSSFREKIVDASNIYHYILIIYSVGIAYIISAGNKREMKLGIILYSCSAIIFFLTGNKGEVLYATLACIGASQYRGFKIKPSLILFISFILFIFIPLVTGARENGVLGSIDKIGFSLTDAFVEIGMQLRLNVYILEQFVSGSREFIDGFSYFNPLVNIIDRFVPFFNLRLTPPAGFNFNEIFPGYGFNQVAESYVNFGLIGVLTFFFIMGFTISKIESRKMSLLTLAYFTSIVSTLINVTRNSFAFVPGQILMLTILYVGLRLFTKRKVKA